MPAIAIHHTETDEKAWDGPGNKARLRNDENESYYRKAYAWQDADGDPETKAAYKFIHHFVDGEGDIGAASTRGCITGIAVLNGARGGTKIPDSDRSGVYNHLAAHLKDADIEPPELRSEPVIQTVERRNYPIHELRVSQDDAEEPKITGYAALFNTLSEEMWGFRERIKSGAFAKTIKDADIRSLWNHDSNYVLGRNTAGTLTLREDKKGLAFEIQPPDTQWANDLLVTMRRGDVDQMSFGFQTLRDEWMTEEDVTVRTLVEVKLFDISPVTFPAYPGTSAQVRNTLGALGIDFDQLVLAISRSREGRMTSVDQDLVSATVQILQGFLDTAPGQEPHPVEPEGDEQLRTRLARLRRQLEIAEHS